MIERPEPVLPDESPRLVERLRAFHRRLFPIWAYPPGEHDAHRSGLYDLEVVLRLLSLREFADWLRLHGDATQSQFSEQIHEAVDAAESGDVLQQELEEAVFQQTATDYDDPIAAVEDIKRQAALARRLRGVLVEVGALSADDTETDPEALLRALLS